MKKKLIENEAEEYWGTFSIYDHRTPLYRQSLVLFDKVVVPVPVRPIKGSAGEITAEEIKRLSADVDFLSSKGAAVRVDWDPKEFNAWRDNQAGEAIAQLLDKDKLLATRFQLQEAVEKGLLEKAVIRRAGRRSRRLRHDGGQVRTGDPCLWKLGRVFRYLEVRGRHEIH
jgi:hypothetical protein